MRIAILIAGVFLMNGCATIIHGTTQVVPVTSDPPGATVTTDSGDSHKTPAKLKLSRKMDHVLVVTMDGYETEQIQLMKTVSGAVAGNILAGGLIGWGVDAASGAQYKLVPGTVSVRLRTNGYPASHASLGSPPTPLTPADRLRRLEELRQQNLITEEEYQATRKIVLEELGGK